MRLGLLTAVTCAALAACSSGSGSGSSDAATDGTAADGMATDDASTESDATDGGSKEPMDGPGPSDTDGGAGKPWTVDPHLRCDPTGGTFTGGPIGTCNLCTDEAGTFAGAPAGTCNGMPCGGGCTCYSLYGLKCLCPDLAAQTDDASMRYCIALSCGSILCDTSCACTDPLHGTCVCPVDGG